MIDTEALIDSLTVEQKLSLMERLWSDLETRPSEIPAPEWHGDVLARRLESLKDGKTEFVEWSAAKSRLRITAACNTPPAGF